SRIWTRTIVQTSYWHRKGRCELLSPSDAHRSTTKSSGIWIGPPGTCCGGHEMSQRYPTDLTETQWIILAPLIPAAKPGGRPRTTDMREVVNAIFYVLRGGCQWRLLPTDFPPHQTVYHYFRTWRCAGIWERMHDTLRGD